MRFSTKTAITGGLIAVAAAAVTATVPAVAAAPQVQVSLSTPRAATAGKSFTFSYNVQHAPSKGRVVLQRTEGTKKVYATIWHSRKWSGKTTIKAPQLGSYDYRLEATKGKRVLSSSKPHQLRVYGKITLADILRSSSHTVSNNGSLFTYVWKAGTCIDDECNGRWGRVMKKDATTCRSMALQALLKPYHNQSGSAGGLQVEQASADLQSTTFAPDTVSDFNFTLNGGAFLLQYRGTPTSGGNGGYMYLNGTASCYSPHGNS